jgi:anti-anti-sigma factor
MSGDEMVFGSEEAMAGRVELVGDVVVLTLQGEFDVASGPVFNEMVAAAEASGARAVVVDVRELTFLDSTGAGLLWDAQTRIAVTRQFGVLRGSGPAFRTLELTGLGRHMAMVDDPQDLPARR